jgi:hypothetical protein
MVGVLTYYSNEADALATTNLLASSGSYTLGTFGGFSSWRIASNSTGSSSQSVVYQNGDSLNPDGNYRMYPGTACFLEGTEILCEVDGVEKYIPIEQIQPGTLVKTSQDGFKKVAAVGKGPIHNPGTDERSENRLYKCSKESYPELEKDIFLTGCHSILVSHLSDVELAETVKKLGRVFVTGKKYRLMACLDSKAEPWVSEGTYTVWHLALEHDNPGMNYGVYASGLLVETCSLTFLMNKSNMTVNSL